MNGSVAASGVGRGPGRGDRRRAASRARAAGEHGRAGSPRNARLSLDTSLQTVLLGATSPWILDPLPRRVIQGCPRRQCIYTSAAMFGLFLLAWAVAPLLILAITLGLGLLVRRLADGRPGDDPRAACGLRRGAGARLAAHAVGSNRRAAAVCARDRRPGGFLLGRGRALLEALRRSRGLLWPAAAGFVGFAAFAAPVVLSGEPGLHGLWPHRRPRPPLRLRRLPHRARARRGPYRASLVPRRLPQLLAAGYPGAWQADLAAFARMIGTDLIWIYQPLLAITGAMGGVSLYARPAAGDRVAAAAGARAGGGHPGERSLRVRPRRRLQGAERERCCWRSRSAWPPTSLRCSPRGRAASPGGGGSRRHRLVQPRDHPLAGGDHLRVPRRRLLRSRLRGAWRWPGRR